MPGTQVELLLTSAFLRKHVVPMIRHFEGMTKHFQYEQWEDCIAKGGKFVEATLKALCIKANQTLPTGRAFSAGSVIDRLSNLQAGSIDDSIRLLIPRACRFLYDISSNRGGRHDPDEIDPNAMDSNVVVMGCSWILGEMIRHAQHGDVDSNAAKNIVDSLVKRKYPFIEHVEDNGRTYFHLKNSSAVDIALLALANQFPRRLSKQEVIAIVKQHDFSIKNANVAITRISRFVDENDAGQLRILAPGLKKAEEIMKTRGIQ